MSDFEISVFGVLGIITVVGFWSSVLGAIEIRRYLPEVGEERFPLSELRARMPDAPAQFPVHNDVDHYYRAREDSDGSSGALKRPLTTPENAKVAAAWNYREGSETKVCSLPAGAGGSTVDILGKHMAR